VVPNGCRERTELELCDDTEAKQLVIELINRTGFVAIDLGHSPSAVLCTRSAPLYPASIFTLSAGFGESSVATPRWVNASEDEIDPGEKIHSVVVSTHLSGYASRERILVRIELRPGGRHGFKEVGSVEASRPSELPVGRVPPTDAEDVVQQRAHDCPLCIVLHAKSANLLAQAFENTHHRHLPRRLRERGADPRMRVDRVEHAERESADGWLRLRAGKCRVHRAGNDGVAGGGQQIALVGDVPIDSTGTGREPFGERAEGQTAFSAAVQELDRSFNDALP
jgi:hypothetical protein